MTFDIKKIQRSSQTDSLKILIQGSGTLFVPATSSIVLKTAIIPHNFGDDHLIWQVGFGIDYGFGFISNNFTPYATGDGRLMVTSTIDINGLYINAQASTAGSPTPDTTITYYYRVLVP